MREGFRLFLFYNFLPHKHMKKLLGLLALLVSCAWVVSCSLTEYPAAPQGTLHVYNGEEEGNWIYVYGEQEYADLAQLPDKKGIKKVIVKGRTLSADRKILEEKLFGALGRDLEIIYPANDNIFLPPVYRRAMVPRPIVL